MCVLATFNANLFESLQLRKLLGLHGPAGAQLPTGRLIARQAGSQVISTLRGNIITKKKAQRVAPLRPSINSLNQAGRSPSSEAQSLPIGLSEVTALGIRHWTTSFRC